MYIKEMGLRKTTVCFRSIDIMDIQASVLRPFGTYIDWVHSSWVCPLNFTIIYWFFSFFLPPFVSWLEWVNMSPCFKGPIFVNIFDLEVRICFYQFCEFSRVAPLNWFLKNISSSISHCCFTLVINITDLKGISNEIASFINTYLCSRR